MTWRLRTVCTGLVATIGLATGGCGGEERSATAYCEAFYSKAAPIRQGYVDASEQAKTNPLGVFVSLFSAPGDLASIFGGMVDHAPDEIKSDTEIVRDSFKRLQDNLGDSVTLNPGKALEAMGKNLVNGMSAMGAQNRVDAYLNQHCPVDGPLAQKFINPS